MPSFRQRVLDALDIEKQNVKLAVNDRFPKVYAEGTSPVGNVNDGTDGNDVVTEQRLELNPSGTTNAPSYDMCDYAISRQIIGDNDLHYSTNSVNYSNVRPGFIGPNVGGGVGVRQTLDILGFVVGNEPQTGKLSSIGGQTSLGNDSNGNPITDIVVYKNSYPDCTNRALGTEDERKLYSGFWHINGLYDDKMQKLKTMRKSAIMPLEEQTQFPHTGDTGTDLREHSHTDWPSDKVSQFHHLQEDPWSDSLYYGAMRLKLLIKGITIPDSSEKASNHRGLVRLLVVKPKMPGVKVRFTGDTNAPVINMPYPPHWDTDLFYSSTRTLASGMDPQINRDTTHLDQHRFTHIAPEHGFFSRKNVAPAIDQDPNSIHYGHPIPDEGAHHNLSAFEHMTAPINRKAYTVLEDKTFTLDTIHHGVAAQRLEHITIPFNKKIKFAGRLEQDADSNGDIPDELSTNTNNEPLNMHSRPVILLMSMDQKISCQIEGYTDVHEV